MHSRIVDKEVEEASSQPSLEIVMVDDFVAVLASFQSHSSISFFNMSHVEIINDENSPSACKYSCLSLTIDFIIRGSR